MTTEYFDRYAWLLTILSHGQHLTFDDISKVWAKKAGKPLAIRTFHNHREAIRTTFGVNIKCNRADNTYYIDEDDAPDSIRQWMLSTFTLQSLMSQYTGEHNKVVFESMPSAAVNLELVLQAFQQQSSIMMDYQGFDMLEPRTMEVYPLRVQLFKQRWYLIAYSFYKKTVRLYMLERAQNVTVTEQKYPDLEQEDYSSAFYGVRPAFHVSEETGLPCLETVRIQASARQAKFLQQLPLHKSQTAELQADGTTIFTYQLVPNFDFKQELLSYGPEVEVLTPAWLRELVAQDLRAAVKKYE